MDDPSMTRFKIGTAPVNWGLDPHYTWLRQPPYDEVMAEMAQAGYAATELGYNFPSEPAVLKTAAARHGLELASRFCPLSFTRPERLEAELDALEATARLLAAIGVQMLIVADAGDEQREALAGQLDRLPELQLSSAQWRALADTLHRAADRVAPLGVSLAFHNHAG